MKAKLINLGFGFVVIACIVIYFIFWVRQPILTLLLHACVVLGVYLVIAEQPKDEPDDKKYEDWLDNYYSSYEKKLRN